MIRQIFTNMTRTRLICLSVSVVVGLIVIGSIIGVLTSKSTSNGRSTIKPNQKSSTTTSVKTTTNQKTPNNVTVHTKLLVFRGMSSKNIEVVDLETTRKCKDLPSLPKSFKEEIGGLSSKGNPRVCGGNLCYEYDNRTWVHSTITFKESTLNQVAIDGPMIHFLKGLTPEWMNVSSFSLPMQTNNSCLVRLNDTSLLVSGGYNMNTGISMLNTYILNTASPNPKWVYGPINWQDKYGHVCGKIKVAPYHDMKAIILAAGNTFQSAITPIKGQDIWLNGPDSSELIWFGTGIEDGLDGLIVVAGQAIFRLRSLVDTWVKLNVTFKGSKSYAVAFLIPDNVTDCN